MTQQILIFTKTTGYRHDSIAAGVKLIRARAQAANIAVQHTEDSSSFDPKTLAEYAAVVWLQVSGEVLQEPERRAFADYLRAGGGYAGIHCATTAERSWDDYQAIAGSRFRSHPQDELQLQPASVKVESTHPSTVPIPQPWTWTEEWYAFTSHPESQMQVLLRVDERTYQPQEHHMDGDHPICWAGNFGSGKTWYTALGHSRESYLDPIFQDHLWGGITSVLRST